MHHDPLNQERAINQSNLTMSEPAGSTPGGACADFLGNGDNIDCRHIGASDGTGEEREDTWKQQAEWMDREATTNDNSF